MWGSRNDAVPIVTDQPLVDQAMRHRPVLAAWRAGDLAVTAVAMREPILGTGAHAMRPYDTGVVNGRPVAPPSACSASRVP